MEEALDFPGTAWRIEPIGQGKRIRPGGARSNRPSIVPAFERCRCFANNGGLGQESETASWRVKTKADAPFALAGMEQEERLLPMHYRGLIFDLDGTLGNTLPATYRAFRAVFEQRVGKAYTDDEIHAMFGPDEKGVFQRQLPDVWEAAHAEYLAAYADTHDNGEALFDGVAEGLAAFAEARARLAIVTAKGKECAEITLDLLSFGAHFEQLEHGHHDGCVKSENITRVLNAWHMPPEQAVYIGDAPTDVLAARSAGVTAVAAAWAPTANREKLEAMSPDYLFDAWADFQAWALDNLMRMEIPSRS